MKLQKVVHNFDKVFCHFKPVWFTPYYLFQQKVKQTLSLFPFISLKILLLR